MNGRNIHQFSDASRSRRRMSLEENVDEAMRVEVFRLYSVGDSRRRQPKEYGGKRSCRRQAEVFGLSSVTLVRELGLFYFPAVTL